MTYALFEYKTMSLSKVVRPIKYSGYIPLINGLGKNNNNSNIEYFIDILVA